jgi:DNA-binding YbaB/EbfC family protein
MADHQHLWHMGQTTQGRLLELQSELWSKTFDGAAGGGLVRVTADGRGLVRNVVIDPMAFEGRDAELLADLVLAAVADAQRRAQETVQAEMRKLPALADGDRP